MTRKDYIVLARVIGEAKRANPGTSDHAARQEGIALVTRRLVAALAQDNPNFDLARFALAVEKESV